MSAFHVNVIVAVDMYVIDIFVRYICTIAEPRFGSQKFPYFCQIVFGLQITALKIVGKRSRDHVTGLCIK